MPLPISELKDATAYSTDGEKLGSVAEIFVDDHSGDAVFVAINHGLFGKRTAIVPLHDATLADGDLTLAYAEDTIKDAPEYDLEKPLGPEEKGEIFTYFGILREPGEHLEF
ncbi:MAG: PRC-barrel domain-containing protein [Corynebacterium sp.]|nr:PRC-barrel domain-containing protein [Corynebacterium sp.]